MIDEKKYLSPREVSARYGMPVSSLANQRWRRVGPRSFRVGKKIYYDKNDVENYFRQNPLPTIDQF